MKLIQEREHQNKCKQRVRIFLFYLVKHFGPKVSSFVPFQTYLFYFGTEKHVKHFHKIIEMLFNALNINLILMLKLIRVTL